MAEPTPAHPSIILHGGAQSAMGNGQPAMSQDRPQSKAPERPTSKIVQKFKDFPQSFTHRFSFGMSERGSVMSKRESAVEEKQVTFKEKTSHGRSSSNSSAKSGSSSSSSSSSKSKGSSSSSSSKGSRTSLITKHQLPDHELFPEPPEGFPPVPVPLQPNWITKACFLAATFGVMLVGSTLLAFVAAGFTKISVHVAAVLVLVTGAVATGILFWLVFALVADRRHSHEEQLEMGTMAMRKPELPNPLLVGVSSLFSFLLSGFFPVLIVFVLNSRPATFAGLVFGCWFLLLVLGGVCAKSFHASVISGAVKLSLAAALLFALSFGVALCFTP